MRFTSREDFKWSTNSSLYNKISKRVKEHRGEISCSMCPYHRKENYKHSAHDLRNWKQYRTTQYKAPSSSG